MERGRGEICRWSILLLRFSIARLWWSSSGVWGFLERAIKIKFLFFWKNNRETFNVQIPPVGIKKEKKNKNQFYSEADDFIPPFK